jgi:hypothetical protein
MTKKIVSFGDSFVFGSELENNLNGSRAWCALAANELGVEYETLSVPGCGNENITRQIFTYFSNNSSLDTLAVINWTWGARYDFYISGVETWTTLGLSCVPSKLAQHVPISEAEKILEFYKNYPGNSTLWDKTRSLQTIYASQQYLKSLGVTNIQTFMDFEIMDQEWHAPDYIKTLQALTKDSLTNFEGKSFLDWSYAHGFTVTDPGLHPLEDAHAAAKNLWISTYADALGI